MKKLIPFIFLIIFIGILIFGGQKLLNSTDSTNTNEQASIEEVRQGDITSSISASGQVLTSNFLPITTSVNGIVKQIFVKEGDTVTKGQKIMEITLSSDGEETLAQARGSYLSAKNSLTKAKNDMVSKESSLINAKEAFQVEKENNTYQTRTEKASYKVAENSLILARADYDNQSGVINIAEISLNKAWLSYQAQSPIITAPASGIIANTVVVEGMSIQNSLSERTSVSVASIKQPGTPIASLNVSEIDINKIKVGQKVEVKTNSFPDETFDGTVVGIDKIGALSSGVSNYPVIVKFNKDFENILPNMGADAKIIIDKKSSVLYIPTSAIETTAGGQSTVTVSRNDQTEQVEIGVGISDENNTEIISGLNLGDAVIINLLPTQGFSTSSTGSQNTPRGGFGGFGGFLR